MTTKENAILYEMQHIKEYNSKPKHLYNPHNKLIDELPVIYGFNNGRNGALFDAVLIAEDGTILGNHACSSEAYMLYDLGLLENSREYHHDNFKKHYPNGYRTEFVSYDDVSKHIGLMKAINILKNKLEKEDNNESNIT